MDILGVIPNAKCLIKSNNIIYTFNNNFIEEISSVDINQSLITNNGCKIESLFTDTDNVKFDFNLIENTKDYTLYETNTIKPELQISRVYEDNGKVACTVPIFVPIKKFGNPEIYVYDSSNPTGFIINFNDDNISHNKNISFTLTTLFNYDEMVKYRIKVNNGTYTRWSNLYDAYEKQIGYVPFDQLSVGLNNLTIQIATEDETISIEKELTDVILLSNNTPNIAIITSESNSSQISFKIIDEDADDVQYKITITNSVFTEEKVIKDWSSPIKPPCTIVESIDSSDIVPDEINYLKIYYKDTLMSEESYIEYQFMGKYENICFMSEEYEYYSTDKGVTKIVLKYEISAGMEPIITKIYLINNTGYDLKNVIIEPEIINNVNETNIELCLDDNPFIANNSLIIPLLENDETKEFYLRINTTLDSNGILKFLLHASGNIK